MRPHHRPLQPGDRFFEARESGVDPAELREAADQAATVLVRGARASDDPEIADRVLHLADTEGLETLADVWAGAPSDTLAGCLWRLFALRAWVYADPVRAARDFEAGQADAEVARVLSAVADPPGPDELQTMVDQVLRGIAGDDFADVLVRAGAFARVVATGRSHRETSSTDEVSRMLTVSDQLARAADLERRGELV